MIENIKDYKYVDLGLPSGTLWCDRNLGANSESDYGNFYQWGNVKKIENASNISESQYYGNSATDDQTLAISATPGSKLTHNIIPGSEYDAATQELNALWQMPTKAQFEELTNTKYVNLTWIENYYDNNTNISGLLITSRQTNNTNKIFLPVTNGIGSYWSSSIDLEDTDHAINLYFKDINVSQISNDRWHGYSIRPVRRRKSIFVDLGLPSGTLWCDRNVGAGNEYGYGNYYQWGNIEKIEDASNISKDQYWGKDATDQSEAIPATPGGKLIDNITPGSEYDAATVELGDFWQMPTKDQFKELIDDNYVKKEYIEDYKNTGIKGLLITSKINTNKIFLPAAGHIIESDNDQMTLNSENKWGAYWSSSLNLDLENTNHAIDFSFEINKQISVNYDQDNNNRWYGYSIRPVKKEQVKYVDLGLPSGTLWCDRNLGASSEYDKGNSYQWGNVEKIENLDKHEDEDYYENLYTSSLDYDLLTNNIIPNSDYDTASVILGYPWQMPTKEQFEELTNKEYVNITWENKKVNNEDINGINGLTIISKINGNSIFLPVTNFFKKENDSFKLKNNIGSYWSSSIDLVEDTNGVQPYAINLYFKEYNKNEDGNENNIREYLFDDSNNIKIYRSIVSDQYSDVPWNISSIRPVKQKQITFVDLGLPSGTLWCDRNLETENPLEYGKLYQWAKTEGYDYNKYISGGSPFSEDEYNDNTNGATLKTDIIQGGICDTATNNNNELCMPTEYQFKELINNDYVRKKFVYDYGYSGINGILITSRINGNSIFLPAAGYIHYNAADDEWNSQSRKMVGSYWNTYRHLTDNTRASNLNFDNNNNITIDANNEDQNDRRWAGYSIRPIKRYKYNNIISNISYNSSINNINELSEATYNVIENNIYNKLEKEIKNIELDENLYKILLNNKNFNIKKINTIYDEKTPEKLNDDTNINYIILQRLMDDNYKSNISKCSNSLIVYKYKFTSDKNYVGINIYHCDDNGICIPIVQTTYSSES